MTNKEQELLKGFLSKTLNMDEEAMSSLFNEDGELVSIDVAISADAARIAKHKKDKDDQLNRGLREGAEKIEKAVKRKYGIESEAIGIELIEELVQSEVSKVSSMQDEDIEKHPEYIKRKSEWDKTLRDKEREYAEAIKAKDKEFERTKVLSAAKRLALEILERKNPILPNDAQKAAVWKETFLRDIESGNYQLGDNGGVIVLDKDGKNLTNEHGNTIDFNDYVDTMANRYFEFQVADPRSSTGMGGKGSSGGAITFKDEGDYVQKMREAKTPEERAELTKVWKSKN